MQELAKSIVNGSIVREGLSDIRSEQPHASSVDDAEPERVRPSLTEIDLMIEWIVVVTEFGGFLHSHFFHFAALGVR